jgi:hypothetical protein
MENKTCGRENVDQLIFRHQEKKMNPGPSQVRQGIWEACLTTGKSSKERKMSSTKMTGSGPSLTNAKDEE